MPSLRTLFLTQTYPRYPSDTAGPFIREIAQGMVRAGDAVTVLVPHARGVPDRWDDDGVAVRSFRYAPEPLELIGYSRSLHRDEKVRAKALLATPLYVAAARRAVAREIRSADTDVVHAHWIVPNGVAVAGLFPSRSRRTRVPGVTEAPPVLAHGLHGSDVFLAEKPLVRRWVRSALARADLLTGCSPELVERILALGPVGGGRSQVIPYGIAVDTFVPGADATGWRAELGIPSDAVVILGVGRMATKKGFHVLLEAAADLLAGRDDLWIVLAGGGDREEELAERAKGLPPRVVFPGRVERDRLPDLFRAADVFCLPAVHDEQGNVDGLPNVILEAMATGLPVVATRISGIPLAVVHEGTGLLVPEARPGNLAKALESLAASPELRKQYGDAGRRRVEQEFTWDQVAHRYRDEYLAALQDSAAATAPPPGGRERHGHQDHQGGISR